MRRHWLYIDEADKVVKVYNMAQTLVNAHPIHCRFGNNGFGGGGSGEMGCGAVRSPTVGPRAGAAGGELCGGSGMMAGGGWNSMMPTGGSHPTAGQHTIVCAFSCKAQSCRSWAMLQPAHTTATSVAAAAFNPTQGSQPDAGCQLLPTQA